MSDHPRRDERHDDKAATAKMAAAASPCRRLTNDADGDTSMVVRNPAPDASPPSSPGDSRTFTISC